MHKKGHEHYVDTHDLISSRLSDYGRHISKTQCEIDDRERSINAYKDQIQHAKVEIARLQRQKVQVIKMPRAHTPKVQVIEEAKAPKV